MRKFNPYVIPFVIADKIKKIKKAVKIILFLSSPVFLFFGLMYFGTFIMVLMLMAFGQMFPVMIILYKIVALSTLFFVLCFLSYKGAIKIG